MQGAGLSHGNTMINQIFKDLEGAFKELYQEEARRLFRIRALLDSDEYPMHYFEELAVSCALVVMAKYRCKPDLNKIIRATNTIANERQAISARDALYRVMKSDGMISILSPNGVIWELEKKDNCKKDASQARVIQQPRGQHVEYNKSWRQGFDHIQSIVAIKNYGVEVQYLAERLYTVCTIWNYKRFLLGEFKSLAMILVFLAALDMNYQETIQTLCNESFCHLNEVGVRYWIDRVTKCLNETEAAAMLRKPETMRFEPGMFRSWEGLQREKMNDKTTSEIDTRPRTANKQTQTMPGGPKPLSGWSEAVMTKPRGHLVNGIWIP